MNNTATNAATILSQGRYVAVMCGANVVKAVDLSKRGARGELLVAYMTATGCSVNVARKVLAVYHIRIGASTANRAASALETSRSRGDFGYGAASTAIESITKGNR